MSPETPEYLGDTGRTESATLSQTFGAAIQPSRSTPAAVGSAIRTIAAPNHTANQSSDANQDRTEYFLSPTMSEVVCLGGIYRLNQ